MKILCPDCGLRRVAIEAVVVRRCEDNGSWSYRTRCPECLIVFVDSTTRELAEAAVSAGVAVEVWTLPMEAYERPWGPPLTEADAHALHLELVETSWLDGLSG